MGLENVLLNLGLRNKKGSCFPSVLCYHDQYGGDGDTFELSSPIDSVNYGTFKEISKEIFDRELDHLKEGFKVLRSIPAPQRGELVRLIGDEVRKHKEDLAYLITLEAGKIRQESLGEVQEWIDVCDFAVGLSRQLYGLTIVSERPSHRMMEQWHPLGIVGVISAFNFPMAVWAWNSMLAFVCGNPVIWKPSEKTPLCALVCQAMVNNALSKMGDEFPKNISTVILGGRRVGEWISTDSGIPLVSATGSIPMGKKVAAAVGARLGRSLLELGGNNALIVSKNADLELATRAVVFSAVGTTGQRCTSLRRLIVHEEVSEELLSRVLKAYESLKIGDPRDESNLMGPLIDQQSYDHMCETLKQASREGGDVVTGGERVHEELGGYYVKPSIVKISPKASVVKTETFAPILYWMTYTSIDDAIEIQNNVPQGLSSAIFTESMREMEQFLSPNGSDCGIANVNIGTSGAEIGGAFGGEKETGGGRESGSDSWKNYMRRTTNTINYGDSLPLAQGIRFD